MILLLLINFLIAIILLSLSIFSNKTDSFWPTTLFKVEKKSYNFLTIRIFFWLFAKLAQWRKERFWLFIVLRIKSFKALFFKLSPLENSSFNGSNTFFKFLVDNLTKFLSNAFKPSFNSFSGTFRSGKFFHLLNESKIFPFFELNNVSLNRCINLLLVALSWNFLRIFLLRLSTLFSR